MSRIDDLIAEMCPSGVEWKELGEVSHYSKDRIGSGVLNSNNYVGVDNLLAEKKGKTVSSYVPIDGQLTKFHKGNILIGNIRPYLKKIWLATHEGGTNGDVLVICIKNQKTLSPEYLYYVLSSDQFFSYNMQNSKGAKMPRGDKGSIMRYSIPIPPLPIQEEIVRILDAFTTLEAELEAELEARKKQYEHYRDELLSFGNTIEWKNLGEVILSLNTGLNPRLFFNLNTDDADNYYVTIRELQNNRVALSDKTDRINDEAMNLCNNRSKLDTGDVLFSGTGTIGETALVEEKPSNWNIKEGVYSIKPNPTKLNSKFLMFLLRSSQIRSAFLSKAAGGTVKSVPMGDMRKLQIPVPPLAEQARIVEILDRFDALTNDITVGLPAEIVARRKQYEYYRDKLLSFKEKVS